jgi:hypothetical protein
MEVKIPQQSMVYLTVCSLVIAIFILVGLVPFQRNLTSLNEKIAEAKLRIEDQKTLQPVYRTVKQMAKQQGARSLPFPPLSALPRAQVDQLSSMVEELARKANVAVVSITPVASDLAGNPQSLAMEAFVRGDFFSFRKFLANLGGIPSLERIEEIQIQQSSDSMELKVKFWIARS